ncbi:hypothetical protein [Pelotalea chapellei]|uniref:Lipoprotein n=1 Tax=Pelotalea chapellei TaxID=44671 RepID=A0ABS5U6Y6_9BACT|nr:hypothetical protein [Pelotalea chapellei]MBT1071421.1 hypothetical protein [Pelotalea chapellei]
MRTIIGIALTFLLTATPVFCFEGDRVAHFGSSSVYGLASGSVMYKYAENMGPAKRTAASFGIALIPGIAWELKDELEKNNHFDWRDLGADAMGALTGAVAAELINGQLWLSASGRQIRLVGKW